MNDRQKDYAATSLAEDALMGLRDYIVSSDINEIAINPDKSVWVEYSGKAYMEKLPTLTLHQNDISKLASALASASNGRIGENSPIVSGSPQVFDQNVRVQIIRPPAVFENVSLTLRKYKSTTLPVSNINWLNGAMCNPGADKKSLLYELSKLPKTRESLELLLKTAISTKLNIVVSGPTSSGKTTVAKALLGEVCDFERLVVIEDAPELFLTQENMVTMIADRDLASPRSSAKLLESALRMRPDRIIMGELRGMEAFNYLQAINTGHPGSITTIHADTPELALERIGGMVVQSGVRMEYQDILKLSSTCIDLIIQVDRHLGDRGVTGVWFPSL